MGKSAKRTIISRIALGTIFILSIFLLPWWATIAVAFLLILNTTPYELPAGGVMMDILYNLPAEKHIFAGLVFTLTFSALFLLGEYIKGQMRT